MKSLDKFIAKMEKEGLSPLAIKTFGHYYGQVVAGETGLLSDKDIRPIPSNEVLHAADLEAYAETGRAMRQRAVMIVLNGGLGTSMGLTRAKSLIPVKGKKTFLEVKLDQAMESGALLALMNSYNTHADTLEAVAALEPLQIPSYFIQNKFPKVLVENLQPVKWPQDPKLEWNPPGHGDVYTALYSSGLLKKLLKQGVTYGFIANSDNLGATLDDTLLGYFAEHGFTFMMEVAERTPADLKGGHIARHKNGRIVLREIAQCPQEEVEAFQDIRRYRYFNTNNLWINLKTLMELFEGEGTFYLPMIVNPKTVDPRITDSPKVFQIESAMGAAISLFQKSTAIQVSESRFMPVKKCPDLLTIRSNCYLLTDHSRLVLNPKRNGPPPKVSLDPKFFSRIDDFDQRFRWIPSLIDCEALTVEGDFYFEKEVSIAGKVRLKNTKDYAVTIPRGTHIEKDLFF